MKCPACAANSVPPEKLWRRGVRLVYKHGKGRRAQYKVFSGGQSVSHKRDVASAIFVVALVFGSWSGARAQGEITLLAPTIARKPIDTIVGNFQAKTNTKVKVTYVNGTATRQTVAKGQPGDVSLIIGPFPGAIASGTIIPSSATPIANFLTGVAVPKGAPKPDISTPAAVKKALLAAKSIGYEDPDFTVAGQGPWEAINKLGIADQIATKSKVMLGPGGAGIAPNATEGATTTYQHLEKGDIEIGMLLLSDEIPYKGKFDIVGVLPKKICTPTPMVGFISTHAGDPAGAKALLQFLASPESQAIFKDAGLEPHS
jgi:molybdate transport system substrate-binding protein